MDSSLKELKKKERELSEKLEKKRLALGKADGAMQSRFPSGRFELESEIQIYEEMLGGIGMKIKELGKRGKR